MNHRLISSGAECRPTFRVGPGTYRPPSARHPRRLLDLRFPGRLLAWSSAVWLAWFSVGTAAAAEATNRAAPRQLDSASFRIIQERNIFNPHRYASRGNNSGPKRPTRTVEAFTLVGTMSYEKGQFAFFEGTRSEFQKALKPADTIAGYTVTSIAPAYVKLSSGSNDVQLRVGMQMRRTEEGEWQSAMADAPAPMPPLVSAVRPRAPFEPATGAAGPPPEDEPTVIVVDAGGLPIEPPPDADATNAVADVTAEGDDPVLKRLMQRREQELNR